MADTLDGNNGLENSKELVERRKLLNALLARNSDRIPQDLWEGLTSLTDAIGARMERGRLDKAEKGQAEPPSMFDDLAKALVSRSAATPSKFPQIAQDVFSLPEQIGVDYGGGVVGATPVAHDKLDSLNIGTKLSEAQQSWR